MDDDESRGAAREGGEVAYVAVVGQLIVGNRHGAERVGVEVVSYLRVGN